MIEPLSMHHLCHSLRKSLYRKGTLLTLNEVMNKLNAEYDRIVQDRAINDYGKKFAGVKGVEMRRSQGKRKGPKPNNICCECGGKGHWKNSLECLKHKGDTKVKSSGSDNIAFEGLKSLEEQEVRKVLMAAEGELVNKGLILDCGATAHMLTDKRYFITLKPENSGHFVTVGGHN